MIQTTPLRLRFLVKNHLGEKETGKGLLGDPILDDVQRVGRDKVPLALEGQNNKTNSVKVSAPIPDKVQDRNVKNKSSQG